MNQPITATEAAKLAQETAKRNESAVREKVQPLLEKIYREVRLAAQQGETETMVLLSSVLTRQEAEMLKAELTRQGYRVEHEAGTLRVLVSWQRTPIARSLANLPPGISICREEGRYG